MGEPAVTVRTDELGVDEICASNCTLHVERMTNDGFALGIDASDGSYWQFWLGAKNGRSHVEVRHTETSPPEKP